MQILNLAHGNQPPILVPFRLSEQGRLTLAEPPRSGSAPGGRRPRAQHPACARYAGDINAGAVENTISPSTDQRETKSAERARNGETPASAVPWHQRVSFWRAVAGM